MSSWMTCVRQARNLANDLQSGGLLSGVYCFAMLAVVWILKRGFLMNKAIGSVLLATVVIFSAGAVRAQSVPPETLRTVAMIVTERENRMQHVPVGTAFF